MPTRSFFIAGFSVLFLLWAALPQRSDAQQSNSQQEQQGQNQQQNQMQDQSQDQSQSSETQDACPFFGKIAKKGNRFFLQDSIHKQTYLLDDSWLAKRHLGPNVLVKGTLNPDTNFIHVRSIVDVHSSLVPRCTG